MKEFLINDVEMLLVRLGNTDEGETIWMEKISSWNLNTKSK